MWYKINKENLEPTMQVAHRPKITPLEVFRKLAAEVTDDALITYLEVLRKRFYVEERILVHNVGLLTHMEKNNVLSEVVNRIQHLGLKGEIKRENVLAFLALLKYHYSINVENLGGKDRLTVLNYFYERS